MAVHPTESQSLFIFPDGSSQALTLPKNPLRKMNISYIDPQSGDIWMREFVGGDRWTAATVPPTNGILYSPFLQQERFINQLSGKVLRSYFLTLTLNIGDLNVSKT